MIGFLEGKLIESSPERVILDVNGVGYEVLVPHTTAAEVERLAGAGSVALHVHTHVREGAIELFGFHQRRQKLLFERLITVGGIGPRLARAILSGMSPEQLVAAITSGDVARLATISGVGKKTAERMVVELKDRIGDVAADLPPPPPSTDDELVQALVNLGYRPSEAEVAVAAAKKDLPDAELEVLLPAALKRLSRA
ncbi:MAG: Holliday junction branch migration protein RuvA [Thermoanaerobaculia bacterium]|nr:Holliday junction branch migration protein RuvA [Thermoanaerobaculia bacterium]